MRAHVEACLGLIARGEARRATVVAHLLFEVERKYAFFAEHVGRMTALLEASFGCAASPAGADKPPRALGRCGRTGRFLRLVEPNFESAAPARLHNPHTEELWPLPAGGSFKPHGGRSCPCCSFELILFTLAERGSPQAGGRPRSYPLCPHCYLHPPFPGGADPQAEQPCARAPHPEAHPVMAELAVCACPETADLGGVLMLDAAGAPPHRLLSSRGRFALVLPTFVHKIALGRRCGCTPSCRLLQLEFHRDRSPLPDGATAHSGCVLSDPLLRELTDFAAPATPAGKGKGGKGKGGKGKGGKGKGGKGGKGKGKGGDGGHEGAYS